MELWLTLILAFDPAPLVLGVIASLMIRERLLRLLAVPLWVCFLNLLLHVVVGSSTPVEIRIASSLLSGLLVAGTFNVISLLRRDHKTS